MNTRIEPIRRTRSDRC